MRGVTRTCPWVPSGRPPGSRDTGIIDKAAKIPHFNEDLVIRFFQVDPQPRDAVVNCRSDLFPEFLAGKPDLLLALCPDCKAFPCPDMRQDARSAAADDSSSISFPVRVQILTSITPNTRATISAIRAGSSPKMRIRPRGVSYRAERPFAARAWRILRRSIPIK